MPQCFDDFRLAMETGELIGISFEQSLSLLSQRLAQEIRVFPCRLQPSPLGLSGHG